jgi:hypothetical protein
MPRFIALAKRPVALALSAMRQKLNSTRISALYADGAAMPGLLIKLPRAMRGAFPRHRERGEF